MATDGVRGHVLTYIIEIMNTMILCLYQITFNVALKSANLKE